MVTRRHGRIAVETFVEIGFAVAIEIMQTDDAIATSHIHQAIHNFQPQGFEESRCVPLPLELMERTVDARDDPYIAAPGRDCRPAIRKEIEGAETHPRFPRILLRRR